MRFDRSNMTSNVRPLVVAVSLLVGSVAVNAADDVRECFVWFGTYTRGESQGIYAYRMNTATGRLTRAGVTTGIKNPSFLAIHPRGDFLYAVNEVAEGPKRSGAVSAYKIDRKTGALTFINRQSSGGGAPCHVVVDATGRCALVANYTGGNVAALPIRADGGLKPISSLVQHTGSGPTKRQKRPHAHSILIDATNRFAVAADLGTDELIVYRLDAAKGTLTRHSAAKVAPGSGPRHFAFHPGGKYGYVISELSLTATALRWDATKGKLEPFQTLPTISPAAERKGSTADLQVHASGRFVYGSNRGHDSIVVFAVDAATGRLRHVENEPTQGKTPRNFGLDPTGKWLLAENQSTGNVVVFRIDASTGKLEPAGHSIDVPSPVCAKFLPLE